MTQVFLPSLDLIFGLSLNYARIINNIKIGADLPFLFNIHSE